MSFTMPSIFQPYRNVAIFEHQYLDKETNCNVYKLNAEKLSKDECHIFFSELGEELLISTALEAFTFHRLDKKMNEKLNFGVVVLRGGTRLSCCCFPKEFKDVCEKVASIFGMKMKIKPRVLVEFSERKPSQTSPGTAIEFPAAENILCFQGERCDDPELIDKLTDDVRWLGNSLQNLGID